jgi:hypothetical protein
LHFFSGIAHIKFRSTFFGHPVLICFAFLIN